MAAREEGIFIPRRLVFILIIVSLFVNVFFLLMGILIGKDDRKFQDTADPAALVSETIQDDPKPVQDDDVDLDDELSLFGDPITETKRRDPIDAAYLETKTKEAEKPKTEALKEADPPPREETKPEPAPTSTPSNEASQPKSGFYVQVLATSERTSAERFRDNLGQRGFPTVLVREGTFYKVRVGPYRDRAKADREKARVNQAFKVKGWVIKK